uniref:Uncharacterized protein n=1 Tax=Rhizophora mucronata TaxID=61149 RepID=A0A2P2N3K6_RHIMU
MLSRIIYIRHRTAICHDKQKFHSPPNLGILISSFSF